MQLEFTYSPGDFQEGLKIKWPGKPTKPRAMRSFVVAFLMGICFYLWFGLRQTINQFGGQSPTPVTPSNLMHFIFDTPAFFFLILIIVFVFIHIHNLRNRGLRVWKQNFALQQPQCMSISDNGIESETATTTTLWRWNGFVDWMETANIFVLRLADGKTLLIPKRAARSEQQDELRAMFRDRVVMSTGAFPVKIVSKSGAE